MIALGDWARAIPVFGIAIAVAWPLANYVRKERAEAAAAQFLATLRSAQEEFRTGVGNGYATDLASLTSPCPGQTASALAAAELSRVTGAGYQVSLRPAQNAQPHGVDCHGRPAVGDYYAGAQPRSPEVLAQEAFATTASAGPVFVFFDGIAPVERDMETGGLAVPLEALDVFKIP